MFVIYSKQRREAFYKVEAVKLIKYCWENKKVTDAEVKFVFSHIEVTGRDPPGGTAVMFACSALVAQGSPVWMLDVDLHTVISQYDLNKKWQQKTEKEGPAWWRSG